MSDVFYRGTGSNAGRPAGPHDPIAGHPYFGPDQGIDFDDLSTGQPAPKAWPGTLTFEALRARVDATFSPNSQRHNEVMLALAGLKAALDDLAAHGQNLAVIDAPPAVGMEYPMALQHSVHGHRVVATKAEEDEARKSGWRRHPTLERRPSAPPTGIFASYWAAPRESD